MPSHRWRFSAIPGQFAICRLAPDAPIPGWALDHSFCSIVRTPEELSIVCPAASVPSATKAEAPWGCLKIDGPFAFEQVGILASFLNPLTEAGISIFALSTFDTDYVLIKSDQLSAAVEALERDGHQLIVNTMS